MVIANSVLSKSAQSKPRPEKSEGYYNILSYILSNAISGEIMAVENYSEMVCLMPDVDSSIDANQQAWEEAKHIQRLAALADRLNFGVEQRIVEPQWNEIRKHFSAAVKKKSLAACLIVQDLMVETMAIVLYKTLKREADTDSETARVAASILEDELNHLNMGVTRLKSLMKIDSDDVHDQLVWAHHRVMPELFSIINTSCHFLCGVLKLDCESLSLNEINTDIETLRDEALHQYMDTLESVGFRPSVVNPLIASMSSYEGMKPLSIPGEKDSCCGPKTDSAVQKRSACC